MAAIPTERLDLDLRELRVEIRESRSDFHDFRGRTDTALSVITWCFRLAVPALFGLWLPMIGLIWYAAKLDSKVDRLDSRVERIEASVAKLDSRADRIEASVDRLTKVVESRLVPIPVTSPSKP
jgi:hypothetical protein